MVVKFLKFTLLVSSTFIVTACNMGDRIYEKMVMINNYQVQALNLARANRQLRSSLSQLQFENQSLKAQNSFLQIKLKKKDKKPLPGRNLASVDPFVEQKSPLKGDMVKDDIFKWSPTQLVSIAESELQNKNFEKSAQYFNHFLDKYAIEASRKDPDFDSILFQAGLAAYESGLHYDWAIEHMTSLIRKYPTSKFHRGAKLWRGLSELRKGNKDKFYSVVEEFRLKYKNTDEWKILSGQYEDLVQKYKK